MKNLFSLLALVSMLSIMACGGADKAKEVANDTASNDAIVSTDDVVKTVEGDKYKVDVKSSTISWKGSKKIGDSHTGTLDIASGILVIDKGTIIGGGFTIDINSLNNTDMAGTDGAGKLEGHLKSEDFFNVAKFPNATFNITKVTPVMNNSTMTHTVSGMLNLMGVAKSISMPATINMTDDSFSATVKDYKLNRTDWGMKYGSGLLGLAADKIINDDVMINIELSASK